MNQAEVPKKFTHTQFEQEELLKEGIPGVDLTVEYLYVPDFNTRLTLHNMHVRKVKPGWSYPPHRHKRMFELKLILEGTLSANIEQRQYHIQKDSLVFILPGRFHSFQNPASQNLSVFCLHFCVDDSLFVRLLEKLDAVVYEPHSPLTKHIRPILDKLVLLAHHANPITVTERMRIQSASFELLAGIGECLAEDDHLTPPLSTNILAKRIAARIEQIAADPARRATVADAQQHIKHIAAELHISTSHCNRVFRQAFGFSPRRYLSQIKLQAAKTMLRQSDMTIDRIASDLGYRDVAQFSRQFKRWTGQSPTQYKKRKQPLIQA
jgi:AraC family transcriptional regulator, transcriptional activator of pobA